MFGCPLGIKPCDQTPSLANIKVWAIDCPNFFYCRSWTLPWSLPLHRMPAHPGTQSHPVIPHDYYVVKFLSVYGYGNEGGLQERNWADYFAEYGYAEAVDIPQDNIYIRYIKRRVLVHLPNGIISTLHVFDSIFDIRRKK